MVEGYMGGFIGKLGPAIGYRWRGRWCLRSVPQRVRNPRTAAQQAHRMLFRDMVRLAGRMRAAVNIGLHEVALDGGMTECNLFVRLNKGQFTADGVDFGQLLLSVGPVAPVRFTDVQVDDNQVLTACFERNPLHQRADSDDEVFLYVYNALRGRGLLAAPVLRRDRQVALALPDGWADEELYYYAFVRDRQGRTSDTIRLSPDTAEPEPDNAPDDTLHLTQAPGNEIEAADVSVAPRPRLPDRLSNFHPPHNNYC